MGGPSFRTFRPRMGLPSLQTFRPQTGVLTFRTSRPLSGGRRCRLLLRQQLNGLSLQLPALRTRSGGPSFLFSALRTRSDGPPFPFPVYPPRNAGQTEIPAGGRFPPRRTLQPGQGVLPLRPFPRSDGSL